MHSTESEDNRYFNVKKYRALTTWGIAGVLAAAGAWGLGAYLPNAKNRRNDPRFHADVLLHATPHEDAVLQALPSMQYFFPQSSACDGEWYHLGELQRLYRENPEGVSPFYAALLDKRYDCRKGIAVNWDSSLQLLPTGVSDTNHELTDELFIVYVNCWAKTWDWGSSTPPAIPPGPAEILFRRKTAPTQTLEALDIIVKGRTHSPAASELVTRFEAARLLKNDDQKKECVDYYQACSANRGRDFCGREPLDYVWFQHFENTPEALRFRRKYNRFTIRELFGEQNFEQGRSHVWLAYTEPELYLKIIQEKTSQQSKEE